ncbi:uncharacterized protein LOC115319521 [Ixodes scapularis]|uniref:uncharacterized protein LOC115319521 n=1 Tax=Ixodes scapularis TaxID=6945 RepID=UPI001A9E9961|nr:uncharacterized protein LOC115319521 [Ixodes scapularis]
MHTHCDQSDEVPSSNAMEKVAFVRGFTKLKKEDFTIGTFISDRHPGVEHHMRPEERGTKHYFDTWHIDKGLKKKLQAASRKSESRELQVWVQPITNDLYYCAALGGGNGPLLVSMWLSLKLSLLNHVVDKHDVHDGPFSECLHQPLSDRAWLTEGKTPAYNKLRSIVSSPRLLKEIRHLSPGSQTSSVEAFNSVLIGFASKSRAFTPEGMEAKTLLAALHYNENVGREQATTREGARRFMVVTSRARKGHSTARPIPSDATFEYHDELMDEVMTCLEKWPTLREAFEANASQHLPPMYARYPRPPKSDLIAARRSRFSSHAGSSQDQS